MSVKVWFSLLAACGPLSAIRVRADLQFYLCFLFFCEALEKEKTPLL